MKVKYILIVWLASYSILLTGALFKVLHWPFASLIISISIFIKVICTVLFMYKLFTYSNLEDFLNS